MTAVCQALVIPAAMSNKGAIKQRKWNLAPPLQEAKLGRVSEVRCVEGIQVNGTQLNSNLETRLNILQMHIAFDSTISVPRVYIKELS